MAIAAALAATASFVGLGAGRASAYSDTTRSGRIGAVIAPPATGSTGSNFSVPGVTVARNGSAATSSPQAVDVTYYLQYYRSNGWVVAMQITQTGTIQSYANAVTLPPISLQPWNIPAYSGAWRVAYGVQWRGPWQPIGTPAVVGTEVFVPSSPSDMRCGSTRCAAYPGYLWLT